MQRVLDLIEANPNNPADFSGHYGLLRDSFENVQTRPDKTIDCCKSLLEGVSKTILMALSKSLTPEHIEGLKFGPAWLNATKELRAKYSLFDETLVAKIPDFAVAFANIRNSRGEISHGHISPKLESSTREAAALAYAVTEGLVVYMLECFYKIDDYYIDKALNYSDDALSDFNDYLDEQYPLPGKVRYSKALFDADIITYQEQLEVFNDLKDND